MRADYLVVLREQVNNSIVDVCSTDLTTGRDSQITTGGRPEWSGFPPNLPYMVVCTARAVVK